MTKKKISSGESLYASNNIPKYCIKIFNTRKDSFILTSPGNTIVSNIHNLTGLLKMNLLKITILTNYTCHSFLKV